MLLLAKFYDYIEDIWRKFIPLNISTIQRQLGLTKLFSSKTFRLYGTCVQCTSCVYAHTFEGEGLNNTGNHSSFDRHPIMN